MRSPAYIFPIFSLCLGTIFSQEITDPYSSGGDETALGVREAYSEDLARAFLTLDDDNDRRVDMRRALSTLMRRGFARPGGNVPSSYVENGHADLYRRKFADADKDLIKLIKPDATGMVGVLEVIEGTSLAVNAWIDRRSSGSEDATSQVARWMSSAALTLVIDRLDIDGDRRISGDELSKVLPKVTGLPEKVSLRESRWWLRELPTDQQVKLITHLLPATDGLTPTFAWSPAEAAFYGELVVVRYRAALFGSTLVVEASHTEGWKTYAKDNVHRAREVLGEAAECEQPTVINLPATVATAGDWRQTRPKNYSNPEINWFTWGFEGKAYFSIELESWPQDGFEITVSAQVCDSKSCAMANNLVLKVPAVSNEGASPAYRTVEVVAAR